MSERVDFSQNAKVYDRRHGAFLSDDEVRRLWQAAGLEAGNRVLDIGAGTGRVTVPFAACSADVVALEPAPGMVAELQAKASGACISVVGGEAERLPFVAAGFHAVVIARLLYLTSDWRAVLREATRVVAPGGYVLHEWGNGHADEAWVQIREEARRLFEHAGVPSPFHPGVRSEVDVHTYLQELGATPLADVSLGPGPTTTLGTFLRRLVEGELSYTWAVPHDVRMECLPRLLRWSEESFDLEQPLSMPREIRWRVYRKEPSYMDSFLPV